MAQKKADRHTLYGLWYGGSSYSAPTHEDAEEFDSLKDAVETFRRRYDGDGGYTPAVTEESEMHLYRTLADLKANDPHPCIVLTFGPRGGVRIDRY